MVAELRRYDSKSVGASLSSSAGQFIEALKLINYNEITCDINLHACIILKSYSEMLRNIKVQT